MRTVFIQNLLGHQHSYSASGSVAPTEASRHVRNSIKIEEKSSMKIEENVTNVDVTEVNHHEHLHVHNYEPYEPLLWCSGRARSWYGLREQNHGKQAKNRPGSC